MVSATWAGPTEKYADHDSYLSTTFYTVVGGVEVGAYHMNGMEIYIYIYGEGDLGSGGWGIWI